MEKVKNFFKLLRASLNSTLVQFKHEIIIKVESNGREGVSIPLWFNSNGKKQWQQQI